ncbi:DNA polymerase Y family protein [Vibrio makurazakiensis]|uniref:Y-family DNA polymerase n=1 Tax=Vibrio makurazakiensis TaxID=2910250 RepID=UPI003D138014
MLLWIYLHFPQLQLDSLYQAESEHPLIIVNEKDHSVLQSSQIAREMGIKPGMGLGSAAALCHNLQVHPYSPESEQSKLIEIAQWAYLVTSDIVLYPPNGLLIKASNMLSLYDGLDNYWRVLRNHLAELKIHFSFSSGFSPYSTILLGKMRENFVSSDKSEIQQRVERHSLTATELPTKQTERLKRVGITSIADLLKLPLPDIARRFDIDLVNYVGRLSGQFKHPLDFYHPPEKFEQYLELLFDIENVQWLAKPLLKLLNQLEAFLRLRDRVAFELSLALHQRDKPDCIITFTSAQGDYLASKWVILSNLKMEALMLDSAVHGMTLSLSRQGEPHTYYGDLFDGNTGTQSSLELLSLLQAKLGDSAISSPQLSHDPRPEKANLYTQPKPQREISGTHKELESNTDKVSPQRLRPSLLLDEPQKLTEKVELTQGPERIIAGWWDGDKVIRDYFIARSEQGRWLWVYRTPGKHWFLHGLFC